MKTPKRKITKAEREERNGIMEKIAWSRVLVVRRLVEGGWTNMELANVWNAMDEAIAHHVIAQSQPSHHWCDESHVAEIVEEIVAHERSGMMTK